jgi:hypothetical protein
MHYALQQFVSPLLGGAPNSNSRKWDLATIYEL